MTDRWFRRLLFLPAAAYAGFMLVPLAALLGSAAPGRVSTALRSAELWSAVGLSLLAATAATGLAVLGAGAAAYLLVGAAGRLARLMATILELPLVLPPAVAGLALILAFGRYQPLGRALAAVGLPQLALTPAAVVLAQLLVASPLFFRAARTAFAGVPERVRQSSAVLGASEWTTLRRVVLPLAREGLAGGALLTWSRAVGELGATLLFAGSLPGRTLTMPTAIFVTWQSDMPAAVGLSVILLLCSMGALWLARRAVERA